MPRLLIATSNAGKMREIRAMLDPLGWTICTPADLGLNLDPEETGVTYTENATIKAGAFVRATGMPVLADDSGLEVDALDGRPGVYSARYGGPDASWPERLQRLLDELHDVPEPARGARFRAVIVIAAEDGRTWRSDGVCEGFITSTPRGENGFGYDPLFCLPDCNRTMAELTDDEKNRVSHRAMAMRGALATLRGLQADPAFAEEADPWRSA